MKNSLQAAELPGRDGIALPARTVAGFAASRARAIERVLKGGSLAILGFGAALLIDLLNFGPGMPLWIGSGAALTVFGAGAAWAGAGAAHLVRYGRRGSSLWLISLAGLGTGVVTNVGSGLLLTHWSSPILGALHRLAMASCGFFTIALIIIGLIVILRGMLDGAEPEVGEFP